jgi:hypothetical protein
LDADLDFPFATAEQEQLAARNADLADEGPTS